MAPGHDPRHRAALLDWMACAIGGAEERAARAARSAASGPEGRVIALGAAGHALDFDDTYLPGIAHLSAAVAPAAIVTAADRGASLGELLAAFAAGFETMASLSRAAHPALYGAGWHPTAVCGGVGAAVATARLLELGAPAERSAVAIALARSAGLRATFGSDGKALQVGMAAATGLSAAHLARAGASVPLNRVMAAADGWSAAFGGGDWLPAASDPPAVAENWIKAWPCCLQTHGAIEAGLAVRAEHDLGAAAEIVVTVHPVSRRAAVYDDVAGGLQAKFSIPYMTAFALLRGAPRRDDLRAVDEEVRAFARRITIRTDPALRESEASLAADGAQLARIGAARGSPEHPLDADALAAKHADLGAGHLLGALDDHALSAGDLLDLLPGKTGVGP